jgi:hypothetical protein
MVCAGSERVGPRHHRGTAAPPVSSGVGAISLSVYLPCTNPPHGLPNTLPADDPAQGDRNAAVHDRDRRIDGLRVAGEPSEVNALGAQEALDLLPRWRQHGQASLRLLRGVLLPNSEFILIIRCPVHLGAVLLDRNSCAILFEPMLLATIRKMLHATKESPTVIVVD